ncbi:TIR domain-containing protein [Paraburkholderia sp. MM5482-R1]|uniref:TIR domain-containing protein n=1 Tax=unclassified Paraburkholderia TaxID=2615204 RepID=UPI003D220AB1
MDVSLSVPKRFMVALSFAGEHRAFVEQVAVCLQQMLGASSVFYDNFYIHELARPNLDTYLLRIYRSDSELIVVFLCENYAAKEWCGLEWRAVRDMIKARQTADIMPFVFGNFDLSIDGFLSIDGYIRIGNRSAFEAAELIVKRVELREASLSSKEVVEIVLDEDFESFDEGSIDRITKIIRALLADSNVRILSKRRGSVILTILLNVDQREELIQAAKKGVLGHGGQSVRIREIRSQGTVLYGDKQVVGPRDLPRNRDRVRGDIFRRGGAAWTARHLYGRVLSALVQDLSACERNGLTDEQCSAVKRGLDSLLNTSYTVPIQTSPSASELHRFIEIYALWNDVERHDSFGRSLQLLKLVRNRARLGRSLAKSMPAVLSNLSERENKDISQVLRSATSSFEQLVNSTGDTFPNLKRSCQLLRVESKMD